MLWRTTDRARSFLLPVDVSPPPGALRLVSIEGEERDVSPAWAANCEVTQEEAQVWATSEFGSMLAGLRGRIDTRLAAARESLDVARHEPVAADTRITADAIPAIASLIARLPRIIAGSLSGDAVQVAEAAGKMTDLQWRLRDAGIELDERFASFPERLAGLRADIAQKRD